MDQKKLLWKELPILLKSLIWISCRSPRHREFHCMVIRGLELVTNCTVLSKTKQKNETVGVESKDGYGVSKWKLRIYLQFLYHYFPFFDPLLFYCWIFIPTWCKTPWYFERCWWDIEANNIIQHGHCTVSGTLPFLGTSVSRPQNSPNTTGLWGQHG